MSVWIDEISWNSMAFKMLKANCALSEGSIPSCVSLDSLRRWWCWGCRFAGLRKASDCDWLMDPRAYSWTLGINGSDPLYWHFNGAAGPCWGHPYVRDIRWYYDISLNSFCESLCAWHHEMNLICKWSYWGTFIWKTKDGTAMYCRIYFVNHCACRCPSTIRC